jgi:hypothetical protein
MSILDVWQFEFHTIDDAGAPIVATLQINGDLAVIVVADRQLAEGTIDAETANIAWQEPHHANPDILDDASNYFPEQLHERARADYERYGLV